MRHCIAIAVIGAALLPLELQAQLRGAPAMRAAPTPRMSAPMVRPAGGGVMRTGLAGPIRFVPGRGVPLRAGFGRPVLARRFMMSRHFGRRHFRFFANQCFNGFIDPFFCRRFFFRNSFFFSPFVGVPAYYGYPYDYSNPAVQPVAAQSSAQDNELGYEVQRLSDDLERLREEESLRREPPSPAPQSPLQAQTEEKATPTTLVFNDGQRTDVQNYAIIGKTLWIFTEQRAKKIPLSELNLAATRKANAERGVEFAVHESQP